MLYTFDSASYEVILLKKMRAEEVLKDRNVWWLMMVKLNYVIDSAESDSDVQPDSTLLLVTERCSANNKPQVRLQSESIVLQLC